MKTRTGFVSNSSSTNFLVGFYRKPESVEELREYLFRKDEVFHHPYSEHEHEYSTQTVAERVFNDLVNLEPLTYEQMVEELSHGWFDGGIWPSGEIVDMCEDENKKVDWDRYKELIKQNAEWALKGFMPRHENKVFFLLRYASDEDDSMSAAIEVGGTFDCVPHLTVNHH